MEARFISQAIEIAAEKAGSLSALARALDWNLRAIIRVRDGEKISAYRAARLVEFLDLEPEMGVAVALEEQARSDEERVYWNRLYDDVFTRYSKARLELVAETAERKAQSAGKDRDRFILAAREARQALAESERSDGAQSWRGIDSVVEGTGEQFRKKSEGES